MEDVTSAGSDLASEDISTPAVETSPPAPASSAREALERAFSSVSGEEKPASVERVRDEAGRFAKAEAPAETTEAPAQPAPAKQETKEAAPAPEAAPVTIPAPQRLAKAAQEAWSQAPEVLRTEVARMEAELTKGISEYQQRWEPLKRFDEMARSGGTTLDQALTAYTNMESMLRTDPVRGMIEVCKNMGIDPAQMAQAMTGQQTGQAPAGASPEVAALKSEIAALKQEISGVGQSIAQRDTLSQVEAFAKANPRFDELSDTIAELLQTGYAKDLQDAYTKAERLNPAPAPEPAPVAVPKVPDPAQTRKATLSITGSPASGSNPTTRKPAGSAREALQSAFAQVNL